MLVLSRKRNESIVVDGRITVSVVWLGGGRVKLGIDCPREVHVLRRELCPADAGAELLNSARDAAACFRHA